MRATQHHAAHRTTDSSCTHSIRAVVQSCILPALFDCGRIPETCATHQLVWCRPRTTGTLSEPAPTTLYDRYDPYDRHEQPLRQSQQRRPLQQRPFTPLNKPAASATVDKDARDTPNSQRSLRRTSRFTASPAQPSQPSPSSAQSARSTPTASRQPRPSTPRRLVHLAAVATGISPRLSRPEEPRRAETHSEDLGDDQDDQDDRDDRDRDDVSNASDAGADSRPATGHEDPVAVRDRADIHPAVRISKRTHNAILFAAESLTRPYKLSPDYEEEGATMADLYDDGSGSNGNGIPTQPPQMPAPAPTSSPRAGIRGPRMIMAERQEREARRAERERMEKAQAEQDARVVAEQRRQTAERDRADRAERAERVAATQLPETADPATHRRQQRAERTAAASSQPPAQQVYQQPPPQPAQQAPQQPQAQQRPVRIPQGAPAGSIPQPIAGPDQPAGATGTTGAAPGRSQPRNSFPHAFERWEALSAHWEGLTSFWIRQLQQRTEEIDNDPLSRQLARQVTDLSAAGANLFHAVVELQRLRASSERKFQRWFFEMRGDMERNTEMQAMLEAALQEERRGREQAIQEAVDKERNNSKIQKQLAEMRKELAISKDEARRAWEELGRREQEERDRIISLSEGMPTIVGGVQVVPMGRGPTERQAQQPQQQQQQPQQQQQQAQAPQQTQPQPHHTPQAPPQAQPPQPQSQEHHSVLDYLPSQQAAHYQHAQPAKTGGPVPTSMAGGEYYQGEPAPPAPHGQEQTPSARPDSAGAPGSDEAYEEEYGTPSSLSAPGSAYPPSATQQQYYGVPAAPDAPDYSGQGFAAPYETVPRHHHPTRLSDVIEEDDERSRTSASQVSRNDRL